MENSIYCFAVSQALRQPQIIGLVVPENLSRIEELARVQLLELRFDTFPRAEWEELLQRVRRQWPQLPLMATIRLQRDGGAWPDEQRDERAPFLTDLARRGAVEWIDSEIECPELTAQLIAARQPPTKLLISSHNLRSAPLTAAGYEQLWSGAIERGGDGVKIVVTFAPLPNDPEAVLQAEALYQWIDQKKEDHRLLAAFSMGQLGVQSRVESPLRGAPWSYGYVGNRSPAAGQWSVEELHRLFSKIVP